MQPVAPAQPADNRWQLLYRVSGVLALVTAVIIPIQVVVFVIWPPPAAASVVEWFELLQRNWLAGVVDLDLLLLVDNLFLLPILLALVVALGVRESSATILAATLGIISVILYIATNPALEMLALSRQYATVTSEVEQVVPLAAGATLLAVWQGTAFHVAYWVGSIAGIIFGIVMLRTHVFSTVTGTLGILGNAIGLGLYVPVIGLYISVFSVLFLEIWYILLGSRLLRLSRVMEASSLGQGGSVRTTTVPL